MSRRRLPNGRNNTESRHVRLYHYMLNSDAWRACSVFERALYVLLASLYRGSNNGAIGLSVRQAAAELNVSKTTVARAFEGLAEKGFIEPVQKGAFSLKLRHASTWLLTEFPSDLDPGSLAKKTFARWHPEIQKTVPPEGLTVPPEGPNGTTRGTVTRRKGPDGTTRGTVKPGFDILTVPPEGHS